MALPLIPRFLSILTPEKTTTPLGSTVGPRRPFADPGSRVPSDWQLNEIVESNRVTQCSAVSTTVGAIIVPVQLLPDAVISTTASSCADDNLPLMMASCSTA